MTTLFDPITVGAIPLSNRIAMAPLTRNRSQSDGTPKSMAEIYYNQRAAAGLIISEATQISDMGKGYIDTPGIHKDAHVEGWKKIVDAVHAGGGRIFCQLWHVGRISHVSLLPDGKSPVSSSAVRADTQTFTEDGFVDCSDPVALTAEQIDSLVDDYEHAARCAKKAGFDGVEVHSANGYLLDQFLQDGVNKRDDEYGGSIENRMRLLGRVIDRVKDVFPANRVGVRVSPLGQANDISDSDPEALFSEVYKMLSTRQLAFLHAVESFYGSDTDDEEREMLKRLRKLYDGFYIGNGSYDGPKAADAVNNGEADAITFGRPFIANPDLPLRILKGGPFNEPNEDTFYGGDETGYTDYPFLDQADDGKG